MSNNGIYQRLLEPRIYTVMSPWNGTDQECAESHAISSQKQATRTEARAGAQEKAIGVRPSVSTPSPVSRRPSCTVASSLKISVGTCPVTDQAGNRGVSRSKKSDSHSVSTSKDKPLSSDQNQQQVPRRQVPWQSSLKDSHVEKSALQPATTSACGPLLAGQFQNTPQVQESHVPQSQPKYLSTCLPKDMSAKRSDTKTATRTKTTRTPAQARVPQIEPIQSHHRRSEPDPSSCKLPQTDPRSPQKRLCQRPLLHSDRVHSPQKGSGQKLPLHSELSLLQKGPSQRAPLHSDPIVPQKVPSQRLSLHSDPSVPQKVPSQKPSLHADPTVSQKVPGRRASLQSDPKVPQKVPNQRLSLHSNPPLPQKVPSQKPSLHADPTVSQKVPSQRALLCSDPSLPHQVSSQKPSLHADPTVSRKVPSQRTSPHSDPSLSQKVSSQKPSLHADPTVSEKTPSQRASLHSNPSLPQKVPSQKRSLHADPTVSQKVPSQRASLHSDPIVPQKVPSQRLSLHSDPSVPQKVPSQKPSLHADPTVSQKVSSRRASLQSDPKVSQKVLNQRLSLHSDPSLPQKVPSQKPSLRADPTVSQKVPSQRTSPDSDPSLPHQVSSQKPSLHADPTVSRKVPSQRTSPHSDPSLPQKVSIKKPSLHADPTVSWKVPSQKSSLHSDPSLSQKVSSQKSSLHADPTISQKVPSQRASLHADSIVPQKVVAQKPSLHSDPSVPQKVSSPKSSLNADPTVSQKVPSQRASLHSDPSFPQKMPSQKPSLHADPTNSQKLPSQRTSLHADSIVPQKVVIQKPSLHSDPSVPQKVPSPKPSLNADPTVSQKVPSQRASLHSDPSFPQKVPSQKLSLHADPTNSQKVPSQRASLHADSIVPQKVVIQKTSLHLDPSVPQKVPSPKPSLNADPTVSQKVPSKRSSIHSNLTVPQKVPSQRLSPHLDPPVPQKVPSPKPSLHADPMVSQKVSSQRSSLHSDPTVPQKVPSQRLSLHPDRSVPQKVPSQRLPFHSDPTAPQKMPTPEPSLHANPSVPQKVPNQRPSPHLDPPVPQKVPSPKPSLHADPTVSQKVSSQRLSLHSDPAVPQKVPSQRSSLHSDTPVPQKVPSKRSLLHSDYIVPQKVPSQGQSLHSDPTVSQKVPSQRSSLHSDTSVTQKVPSQRSSLHSDGTVPQKIPSQGSSLHAEPSVTQKGPSQRPSLHSDLSVPQKLPGQGLSLHSEPTIPQKVPSQRLPLHSGPTVPQNVPNQRPSLHSDPIAPLKRTSQRLALQLDPTVPQKGPSEKPSLHSDSTIPEKGPSQRPSLHSDSTVSEKGSSQRPSRHSDPTIPEKGSSQRPSLHSDSTIPEKGPSQRTSLHSDPMVPQKGPSQRPSLNLDPTVPQKGLSQRPSLHSDPIVPHKGFCQRPPFHLDNIVPQERPNQQPSLHSDPTLPQKRPFQRAPYQSDNSLPQTSVSHRPPPAQSHSRMPEVSACPRLSAQAHGRLPLPDSGHRPFLQSQSRMPQPFPGPRSEHLPEVSLTIPQHRPTLQSDYGKFQTGPSPRPSIPSDSRMAQTGPSHRSLLQTESKMPQTCPCPSSVPPLHSEVSQPAPNTIPPAQSQCKMSYIDAPYRAPSCVDQGVSQAAPIYRPLPQSHNTAPQACLNPRLPRLPAHAGFSCRAQPQPVRMPQSRHCSRPQAQSVNAASQPGSSLVLPCQPDFALSVQAKTRFPPPQSCHRALPKSYNRLPPPAHGSRPQMPLNNTLVPSCPVIRLAPQSASTLPPPDFIRRPPPPLHCPPPYPRLVPKPVLASRHPLQLHSRLPQPYPRTRPLVQPHNRMPVPRPDHRPPLPSTFSRPSCNGSTHHIRQPFSTQQSSGKQRSTHNDQSENWAAKSPVIHDPSQFPANPFMGLSIKGNWCTVPKELSHGDKDERTFIQLEPSLKMMFSFDVDNPVKWTISKDRQRSLSCEGSYISSDSLSAKMDKTDTDSNSRDTPLSWEPAGKIKKLKKSGCSSMCFCHSFNTNIYPRDDQDSNNASDSASSKDGLWDVESEEHQSGTEPSPRGCRVNGPDGSGVGARGLRRHCCHCQKCPHGEGTRRLVWKRQREDSPLSDSEMDWEERLWRAIKRLRPDNPELKALAAKEASETPPEDNTPSWTRSSPADLYFTRNDQGLLEATQKMKDLENTFEEQIIKRAEKARASMSSSDPPVEMSIPSCHHHPHSHSHYHNHRRRHRHNSSCSSSSESSSDSDSDDGGMCNKWMEEMDRKRKHPFSLHSELWYNDSGEMNNGPLCRCSLKARKSGIRHDIYPGEDFIEPCNSASNNLKDLHHYRITMSPSTNFLTNSPSVIKFDNHEFIFEGFSLFTHEKLDNVPLCKVIRFHIEYTVHFIEEQVPENFTMRSLDLITQYLFKEILELVDLNWVGSGGGCSRFHVMPRFARLLPENGKEILSMNEVLKFLLRSSRPLVSDADLTLIQSLDKDQWQTWVEVVCGMIVTYPGKKPSSIRVDQLDRTKLLEGENTPPILVHFGIRPAQLSYAGDPVYQKAWKHYIKFKHLLNSKPKVSREDKLKLKMKEAQLQEIQRRSSMKREVTVELSSKGFLRTGLKSDICQHALLLPVLISHIRFHSCLAVLEDHLQYSFQDRSLLQLALTHTSFRCNYGTNPAHARNSLTNCGLRQVEYGDRRIYYQHTRKRGINILVDIMSRMGRKEETPSDIPHNERLEFLGDAVIEFLSSVHLFFMFPWLEEGGLSTYRTAIVQNQHLAILAENLRLQDFMLFVHGPDLCHDSDLRHAMANCFEALMGALFLDGGLDVVDQVFARTLFEEDTTCLKSWLQLPLHPLQEDEPGGDRHWVESSPALQKLISFEGRTGITFGHVRLLAKAFTHRNVGYNILTMGHNQRLEFLGDTVLQLIASEYLYKHFPEHHEGHLSLLRSSLVNSRTQSIVCDDLGMVDFVIYSNAGSDKFDMKTKQKADLLEAFLGALYVDSGMEFCKAFCDVCFFPRLKDFILNQDWNDPKSQLQQCCLTLRKMGGGEPDIPMYKVIESLGPSNTRKYVVAVYFRGERMATGTGHSIQQAEMSAATNALKMRPELFPILQHQRRFLVRRYRNSEFNYKPYQFHTRYSNISSPALSLPSSSSSCSSASSLAIRQP